MVSRFNRLRRADGHIHHQIIFAIRQNGHLIRHTSSLSNCWLGIDILEAKLQDIADPSSPNFGKHMTHAGIAAITATDASALVVVDYLNSRGVTIDRLTPHGEYITATSTVGRWEEILSAEFHFFQLEDKLLIRTLEYSLPHELVGHVHAVFNTVHVS